MIDNLLKQIKERQFNKKMLFSLYNILEDTSCLVRLASNLNENLSVNDFEWLKLDIEEETVIQDVYVELKHCVEREKSGLDNGIFIVKKDDRIYCVKLISFNVNNI